MIKIYGKKTEADLKIHNKEVLDHWVNELNEGDAVEVTFMKVEDLKSHRQLRLIYHCFREISNYTGYLIEEIKLRLKMQFGYCYHHNIEGKDITVCKSLSDFSKKELSEFIIEIDRWSSETLSLPLLRNDDIKFLKL